VGVLGFFITFSIGDGFKEILLAEGEGKSLTISLDWSS
jgi:hypothetical protein